MRGSRPGRAGGGTRGRQRTLAVCGLILLAGAWTAAGRRDVEDRVRRVVALPPSAALHIDASNAEVRVVGTARDDIALDVERRAPSTADLDRLPLVVESDATRVRIAVVQSGTDVRLQATLRLEVPRRARIESLRIAEGRLEVVDVAGRLTADVRRGPIVADRVSGELRLETGIGDVTVRQARLAPDGLLRLRTFNGDVHLAFAEAPADARVLALALNGTIASQLPLTMKTGWGPRWGEATIGRGEPVVSLDVVTGDIRIDAPARRP